MPIVLATAEGKEQSGYLYDDQTGVSYEYPNRYAKLVQAGEPFVYHIPRRGYTGAGIIGAITPSDKPAHWVCSILDYAPFDADVPLLAPTGQHFEAKPGVGVYWSQGVRPLSVATFEAIMDAAAGAALTTVAGSGGNAGGSGNGKGGYASPETAAAVEAFSIARAKDWLAETFVGLDVLEMPHSNPGFDLVVGSLDAPVRYVEVKGTQAAESGFWMSEGERQFSIANADAYLLIIVSSINLKDETSFSLRVNEGAVDGDLFDLAPSQWRGTLK